MGCRLIDGMLIVSIDPGYVVSISLNLYTIDGPIDGL